MTTAREIMSSEATCVRASDPVHEAAVRMADLGVGALPICGEDDRLQGMITDRDIVVEVLAQGKEPRAVHAGELAQGEVVTIGADDDVADLVRTMAEHKVRRVPVVDEGRLVGVIAMADVARRLDDPEAGLLLEALSTD